MSRSHKQSESGRLLSFLVGLDQASTRLSPVTGEGRFPDMRDCVHSRDHNRLDHAGSFAGQQVPWADQLTVEGGPSVPAPGGSHIALRKLGVHPPSQSTHGLVQVVWLRCSLDASPSVICHLPNLHMLEAAVKARLPRSPALRHSGTCSMLEMATHRTHCNSATCRTPTSTKKCFEGRTGPVAHRPGKPENSQLPMLVCRSPHQRLRKSCCLFSRPAIRALVSEMWLSR